ncbi:Uncharacterized protein GBIM_17064 [Gryllus bimaculatus]|nr:Uncharacterized protein GBIM_17064 [Gryllus bimaculatus]
MPHRIRGAWKRPASPLAANEGTIQRKAMLLGVGGLTAATGLSVAARCFLPPTFLQDATKLQLGAVPPPSHEQLIRQASTMTVDAATQLLSQTVLAYIELSKQYREAVDELIDVLTDDLQFMVMETSHTNEDETPTNMDYSQEVWEREVEARAQVNSLRTTLLELASYMEYVTKVATAAAEASYLAGSEFASTNMCERLNSAHRTFEEEKSKNKEADRELLKVQEDQASVTQSEDLTASKIGHRIRRQMRPLSLLDPLDEAAVAEAAKETDN